MPNLQEALFKYQREDVKFYTEHPRVLNALEMGLGKTEEFIATCDLLNLQKVLIVCPFSLVLEWQQRLKRWLNEDANVFLIGPYKRFNIINYEMLRDKKLVIKLIDTDWDMIGYDEAHRVKNRKAQQSRGANVISKYAKRIMLISGTPLMNHPWELWHLLHMIDPQQFNDFDDFAAEYCVWRQAPWGVHFVNAKNLEKLRDVLHPYMVRRTKQECLPDLPDKIYRIVPIEMNRDQLALYKSMEEELFIELDSGKQLTAPSVLAALIRLRQICCDPIMLGSSVSSSKTGFIKNFVEDLLEETDKIVIFTHFDKYAQILARELNAPVLSGSTDVGERQRLVNAFQNEDNPKVLIGTIGAMGVGLTLTRSSVCIFADRRWNPAENSQAEDRLHRIGQKDVVNIIDFPMQDSIEMHLRKVLEKKEKMFDEVMTTAETLSSMRRKQVVTIS